MKVARPAGIGQPLFVLPDLGHTPLAGPFTTVVAARLWIVEKVEASLKGAKADLWRETVVRLPAPTDMGLELAVVGFVAHGMGEAQLAKYVPRTFSRRDGRALAAGEAA